ncbi:hypothetical protein RB594_009507 [Gaeumannomyces avenae]
MSNHSDGSDFLASADVGQSTVVEGGNGQRRPSPSLVDPRPTKRVRWGDDSARTRVSRACDRCKTRKTKCSGKFPCSTCVQAKLDCRFTAAYRRGRLPSIEPSEETTAAGLLYDESSMDPDHGCRQNSGMEQDTAVPSGVSAGAQEATITSRSPREPVGDGPTTTDHGREDASVSKGLGTSGDGETPRPDVTSSRNSPEPSQTDQQGHYVGPSSGVSFLLRLQRKLQAQMPVGASDSSIFTFGDMPLPDTDPTFVILPPKNEAESMVRRYFDFAHATQRFLHRPTVEEWLAELYETNGAMRERDTARCRTALLFMVFAQSISFPSSAKLSALAPPVADIERVSHTEAAVSSVRFFSAAEHQLTAERGRIRLTSVQARLAQCLYLLAHSRLNHCWTLFGTTAHLVIALGIHRKARSDSSALLSQPTDQVESECRKRTFWCAYNLDIYLSSVLGRPRAFHDEDIDQELPVCVDDSQLSRRRNHHAPMPAPRYHSIMTGAVAHHKLSRILAGVLRDLYGIKPPSRSERLRLADKYTKLLFEWRGQVAYLLDTGGDSSMFVPIVLRQRDVLKLAFWHSQILVHRPFLLGSFASLASHGSRHRQNNAQPAMRSAEAEDNVRLCLDAATNIARLVHDIDSADQLYSTMFLIPYYGFCAVVVLYVHAIQQRNSPPETYLAAFNAATICQDHLASVAIRGTLTERYGVVLQELRNEVLKHCPYLASATAMGLPGTVGLPSGMNGVLFPASNAAHVITRNGTLPNSGQATARCRRMSAPSYPGQRGGTDMLQPVAMVDNNGVAGLDPSLSGASALSSNLQQLFQAPNSAHPISFPSDDSPSGSGGSPMTLLTGWGQFESLVTGGMMERFDAFFADSAIENWDMALHGGVGA